MHWQAILDKAVFVNPTSSATQSSMNEGTVTSLGLDFGMNIGKKWTLESGIQYTNVQNQSVASLLILDSYSRTGSSQTGSSFVGGTSKGGSQIGAAAPAREVLVEDEFDHSINMDNSLRFTSIPLKAGYYVVDNKLSLRLNAGLAANYFSSK